MDDNTKAQKNNKEYDEDMEETGRYGHMSGSEDRDSSHEEDRNKDQSESTDADEQEPFSSKGGQSTYQGESTRAKNAGRDEDIDEGELL